MVETKNKVIRTFCFYSTLHVICTKEFLKVARLGASFDSVSRLFDIFAPCRKSFSANWRKFSLEASGLSQYFVYFTKSQTTWQQTYFIDIDEQAHF